jgi:DNA-binding response OmpR family regulator
MYERDASTPIPTILLAEGNQSLRRWLGVLLSEAGYRVIQAGTGPDVLRLLRGRTPIDLLITNSRVGKVPGWEIAQYTSQLRPGVRMVRLIESRADGVPIYGADPDTFVLLQKPFTITELVDAVRTLLARGSDLSVAHRVLGHT